jgi:hypothetical protein
MAMGAREPCGVLGLSEERSFFTGGDGGFLFAGLYLAVHRHCVALVVVGYIKWSRDTFAIVSDLLFGLGEGVCYEVVGLHRTDGEV